MRILRQAAVAAIVMAGSLSAYAQSATTAPQPAPAATPAKASKNLCKGLAETACVDPTCKWYPEATSANGKVKKAHCGKVTKTSLKTPASTAKVQ